MKTPQQQAAEYAIENCTELVSHRPLLQAAFLAGYNAAGNKWVDVNVELPLNGKSVLCYMKNSEPFIDYYQDGCFRYSHIMKLTSVKDGWIVTHWQPLPSSPICVIEK